MIFSFSRKALIPFLWIVPVLALSAATARGWFVKMAKAPEASRSPVKVPIQVITPGKAPRMIYVELDANSIPGPSAILPQAVSPR